MEPWALVINAGSLGFVLCLVPQLLRTLKRGRADDISVPFLVLVLCSSGLTLPYMVHKGEATVAAAQAINLLVWGIVLRYRLFPRASAGQLTSTD